MALRSAKTLPQPTCRPFPPRRLGPGGTVLGGAVEPEASEEEGPHPSDNTSPDRPAGQHRLRAPNVTTLAEAFPRFGLGELRKQTDGSPPPGGRHLTSQHIPTHDSHIGQGTPSHYSSSTRGPHQSPPRVRKKHASFPTSATKRARATGSSSGGAAEQGVAKTLEEQGVGETLEEQEVGETLEERGEWRPHRGRDPGQDSTSRCWAWSGGGLDSFGSGGASGPSQGPGLPGAAGPTKIGLQSQLPTRRAPCY